MGAASEEPGVPFRVETVMLGPETDQYAGRRRAGTSIEGIAAAARRAEELGFDGVTTPEAGHDPFLPLAIAAEHTSRVTLGTNVAIAFPRSPMVTAQLAWDLQQLSGGRFRLGLGTQVKGHNERRYAAPWTGPPGPRLRDYILCLQAMFESFQNGKRPRTYGGQHYQFSLLPPFFNPGPIDHPHVPLQIAAVNRYMARLAGELCDGLRLHPIATFRFTREVILPAIEAGARKSDRRLSDIDVIGAPFLAIGKDARGVQAAMRALKQRIAFYASTPTYHSVLEFHGWEELGRKLHQLSREGKWPEMWELITDDMVQEFAIIGTVDELAPRLKERCTGIFSTLLLDLPPELREDDARIRATIQALRQP
jgi:probable F420-dependent oxidoreductase